MHACVRACSACVRACVRARVRACVQCVRVVPCCRACVRAREGASEGGRKRGRARAREGESERLREGKRGSERAREGGREGGTSEEGRREGRVHGKRGPARASPCMDTRRTEKRSSSELFKFFRSIFVLKPKFFNCVETKIVLPYFSRGSVRTGGPTASRTCQNWRVSGAGATPNSDKAPGSGPETRGSGCFRAL